MPHPHLFSGCPSGIRHPETTTQVTQALFDHAYPDIQSETRPNVPTDQAAYYLLRKPQTLRIWAMRDGSGPVRPLRVNGRLAWPIAEIKRVLGVAV